MRYSEVASIYIQPNDTARIFSAQRGRAVPLCVLLLLLLFSWSAVLAQNPIEGASVHQPLHYGVLFQGGNGLTDKRGDFRFFMAGLEGGRVLTNNFGKGIFRGNFEYAIQLFPYWEALTPTFNRVSLNKIPGTGIIQSSAPYAVGGTFHGIQVVPIILRWNFARHGRLVPWAQAAGGLLWTNHKFPAYGDTSKNYNTNGPNGDASVFNFTPQGGIGFHYFLGQRNSIDLSANGVHTSSASLGDRNPGVNAGVQFSIGYSWWK